MSAEKPTHSLGAILGVIFGLIFWAPVVFYCGANLFLIPFAGAGIVLFFTCVLLFAKCFPSTTLKPFIFALAVLFGHWAWMLTGGLLFDIEPILPDLVIMFVGMLWLVLRPGAGPVILLSLYEIFALFMNIIAVAEVDFGTKTHKEFTAHIALRLFALVALIGGYVQLKRNEAERSRLAHAKGLLHILMEDGQQAAYEETQVQEMLVQQVLSRETLFWREGMEEWKPLSELPPRMGRTIVPQRRIK